MSNKGTHDKLLAKLKDPKTIRSQAQRMLDLAKQGSLKHFTINPEQMTATASYVMAVITEQYPTLKVPYHSRWRHLEVGNANRIPDLLSKAGKLSASEYGKILYELIIISVFLDAGAGPAWTYKEAGTEYSRSEGLALASLALYANGAFSSHPEKPLRVDAKALLAFQESDLCKGFQVTNDNPLEGVAGRMSLLNTLGAIITKNPHYFGSSGRLGDFYSYINSLAIANTITAAQLFQAVLNAFTDIWPVRLELDGVSLGDVWTHDALYDGTPGSEYIPFHKLSQWLTYSLIEPLEQDGIRVTDFDELTGLPEYRNGGLFIDTGLLQVKDQTILRQAQDPGSEVIIEWRALTVALLDELADLIRQQLHLDKATLPLAKILQGGTWEAGRRIAKQKRTQGTPPIQIISDGTIF